MEKHLGFSAKVRGARVSRSFEPFDWPILVVTQTLLLADSWNLCPLVPFLVNINYLPWVILDAVSFIASSQSRDLGTAAAETIYKLGRQHFQN